MRLHLCAAALAAAALVPPAPAEGPLTLSNEDVVILAQAGLTEDFVIRRIEGSQQKYDLSAGALADLAKRGLSTRVLEAMIARGTKPAPPPAPAVDGAGAASNITVSNDHHASQIEISWLDGEREPSRLGLRLLAQEKVGGRLGHLLTVGVKTIKTKAYVIGPHAQARSRTGVPEFHIRPPEGLAIEEFVIVRMDGKVNRREVEIASGWGYAGSKKGLRFEQLMPTDIQAEPDGTFRMVPQQRLPIGEYFLYILGSADFPHGIAGKGYEFAVD